MAPCAASTTPTRLGRVLHWLSPSRRAAVAVAALEIAATLLGLPLALQLVVGLVLHLVFSVFAD